MTHYEKQVRDELERLARAATDGASEALKKLDPQIVGAYFREGLSVAACVVRLLVP